MTTPVPRFRLVFVIGVAHCGSTFLGRLLNMHPRIFCGGEMMRISRALTLGLPCSCGEALETCIFWKEHLGIFRSVKFNNWRYTPKLYQKLTQEVGADLMVDLSKTLAWKRTFWWWRKEVGYILLVRDSRGILASSRRKGKDLESRLHKHIKWMKRLLRFSRYKGPNALTVFYEDLANHPERELKRIMQFLNLEFFPEMLKPASKTRHFIHSSTSNYLKDSNEIRLDERWRRELDPEEIDQISGAMESVPLLHSRYLLSEESSQP